MAGDLQATHLFDRLALPLGDSGYVDWFWLEFQASQADRLTGPTLHAWARNVVVCTSAPPLTVPLVRGGM